MKRYEIYREVDPIDGETTRADEEPDGQWVKWEDHKARVAELEGTIRAMTETAAEQSRVHVEMHGDLLVQDELILTLGGKIKELEVELAPYRAVMNAGPSSVSFPK